MAARLIPATLRGRLILLLAGLLVFALAAYTGISEGVVNHELRSTLDSALRARATAVAELAVSAPAVLDSPGALESPASGRQLAVEVLDHRGRILARSLTLGARLLPVDALARRVLGDGSTGFENVSISGRSLRLYAAPIAQAGGIAGGGAVLVASDVSDIDTIAHHLGAALVLVGAAIALVGALAAGALIRRGLRPLPELVAAAEEIERTADPDRRLPLPPRARWGDVPDELRSLTGVLNRMLDSLARSRAVERRFLADASHELRTPVTTLLGNIDYAARHGADDAMLDELRSDGRRLARLVDDLLVLERQSAAAPREPVELDGIVEEVVAELAADDASVRIGTLEPVELLGDRQALRRLARNLIDNALVHGRGTVSVSVAHAGGDALLSVSDEGGGPDPDEVGLIFERFGRGRAASGRPGSGLGLSIVAAIAHNHGGRVTVREATFTVQIPAI